MIRKAELPPGRIADVFWETDDDPPDFDEPEAAPAPIPRTWERKTFTFSWTYRDTAGEIIGHVARYDGEGGKDCIPFFHRDNGRWKAGGPLEPKPLYGLNTLKNPNTPAYVVEGEKCAAALHSLGLAAVTSIGGGKAAEKSNWKPLEAFKTVFLLPDNDAPGESYAEAVAGILAALPGAREVLIARLPGLLEKGDCVDWIQARVPSWDGYGPIPRTPGDDLQSELLEAIEAAAEPMPDAAVEIEPWEAPISLDAAIIPPWPGDVFPEPVQAFVDALAESTETPPELPAMLTLAALASCVAGKYRVRIKADYFEPCNLWACVALPPGSRKSAVLQAVTSPLIQFEREQRAGLAPDIQRAESEAETTRARIEALRKKAAKAAAGDVAEITKEIEELETHMPTIPRARQLWTADVTPERLAVLMGDNEGTMAQFTDEGGVFDTLAGRYSNGIANLDVYLQGHDGRTAIRVDRGSRAPLFIENPCLTLGLCPQPDVIAALADKPGFRGRGLLGRFLFAMPAANLGRRTLNGVPVPVSVTQQYNSIIAALLKHGWNETSEGRRAHVLKLSPEAYTAWHAFALEIEGGMAAGGTFEHITDWAGKLPGAVARIAAVLHVARYAYANPWQHDISPDDMAAAIRLGRVLSCHALIAFNVMGADAALDDARAILNWIQREGKEAFTRRDCHAAHKSRFNRSEALKGPLDVLIERGYIRPRARAIALRGGRPSQNFEVNPLWITNPN